MQQAPQTGHLLAANPYLNPVITIWPNQPNEGLEWEPYMQDGSRFFKVTAPTLEHFPAMVYDHLKPKDFVRKAVIICPGGGYQKLSYEKEGQEAAMWLQRLGYDAYVLAYHIPDQPQAALQDIQRAIRLVRATGVESVGVLGFSAGANLSCHACFRWNEQTYPPTDQHDQLSCRPDFGILIYPAFLDQGQPNTLSPLDLHADAQTPPLFVYGTLDDTPYSGPSCIALAHLMQQAGAPIELHYLPTGGHGYGLRYGRGLEWPSLAQRWLHTLAFDY